MTIKVWCASNGIKESSFYYFLREIRKAALQANESKKLTREKQTLVRVELPGDENSVVGNGAVSAIRVQYKGAMLEIPPGTRGEDVSVVLKALDQA